MRICGFWNGYGWKLWTYIKIRVCLVVGLAFGLELGSALGIQLGFVIFRSKKPQICMSTFYRWPPGGIQTLAIQLAGKHAICWGSRPLRELAMQSTTYSKQIFTEHNESAGISSLNFHATYNLRITGWNQWCNTDSSHDLYTASAVTVTLQRWRHGPDDIITAWQLLLTNIIITIW